MLMIRPLPAAIMCASASCVRTNAPPRFTSTARHQSWPYGAGSPNILGPIVAAQALRILLDLALAPETMAYFGTAKPIERSAVEKAMNRIGRWNRQLTARALDGLGAIPGLAIYGPRDASRRTSLVAFNAASRDPV